MYDPFGVCSLETSGRLQHVIDGLPDGARAVLLDQCRQVAPFHVLHDEQNDVIGIVGVKRSDDVLVVELRHRHDLALEAGHDRGVLHHGAGEHLDGNDALHAAVSGLEDLPHAAGPDLFQQDVVAQRERHPVATEDLCRLKLCQFLLADELTGQVFTALRVAVGRQELPQRFGREDPALLKLLHELFKRDGHAVWPGAA